MQVSTLAMNQASRQVNPNLKGLEKGKNIFQFSKDPNEAVKEYKNSDKLVSEEKLAPKEKILLEREKGLVNGLNLK